MHAFDIKNRN